jgi:hypothetical protein
MKTATNPSKTTAVDVLASWIALTVRALNDHNNINFEVTTSIAERDPSASTENPWAGAETLMIWQV